MTQDKAKDDRTRTIGVRMTDEEIADLPPAASDAARVKNALVAWRDMRNGLAATPGAGDDTERLRADIMARLDMLQSTLEARLAAIAEGPDAFHRLALEADARDIETSVCDVWMVCMEIWQQTLNNHLNITLIREALVDGDGEPAALVAERRARIVRLETERFHDFRDRATWMLGVTETWRQMRLRERDAHHASADGGAAVAAPAAAE